MKPILKLYRGYANEQELIVMGHVFKPTNRKDYDFLSKKFKNAKATINMFRIKTHANADVFLLHNNTKIHTKTLDDGYFKFCIPLVQKDHGWIEYEVSIVYKDKTIISKESYNRPKEGDLGIISDIDDTFLVSYTENPLKKIYHLLFKNVTKRKIFEDVVHHYQALSLAGRKNPNEYNTFFYVSSSEWNLYRFIVKFTEIHQLPKAVLLLKDIKTSIGSFFWTGRGKKHNHKFEKIKHVLEFYPNLKYVLLGDDTQEDAYLYEAICKIFPLSIKAVYIRQTGGSKESVTKILNNISSLNVEVCYFKDSSEAIEHSKAIGLID
ncbi:App1 family protein [Flavobacterium sp.]|uniref:App1 family protein n=1 Tax=Flavobacterium sp. TaxID=239 RepID=UPI003C39910F